MGARGLGHCSNLADTPDPPPRYFKNDTLCMVGYGSQGHGQSLNARDQGLKVIVGVREGGESWKQAMDDGWVSVARRGQETGTRIPC